MPLIVEEISALIGAKIDEGEFADVFALFDHVAEYAAKVVNLIEEGIVTGLETINRVGERGDFLGDFAEQFGISAQAVQELGYAATLTGGSVDDLQTGLKFLSKAAADAAAGGKEAAAAFKGVKLKDAQGNIRPVTDLLQDLGDQFAAMPGGAAKLDRAFQLFGRNGQQLVGLMNRGSAGIAALRKEAEDSGAVLGEAAIAAAGRFDDAKNRFAATVTGLENRFASPLIEQAAELFERLSHVLQNAGVRRAVDALSKGFDRLLQVFGKVIDLFEWLTSNEDDVTIALFAIQAVVIGLGVAAAITGAEFVVAAASAAAAWVAAALPFIALGALILLITDDLWTFAEGGDSVLGDLIKWFDKFDPKSSPLMELLKSALSVLFDLTDPKKWERLSKAIADAFNPLKELGAFANLFREDATPEQKAKAEKPVEELFPGLKDPLSLGDQTFAQSIATKFPGIPGAGTSWGVTPNADPVLQNLDQATTMIPKSFAAWPETQGHTVGPAITNVDAPVVVNVPAGVTDPVAVGEEVRKVVREEMGNQFSDANAAVGG